MVKRIATVAQLVEQFIRNERVGGSNPLGGSMFGGSQSDEALAQAGNPLGGSFIVIARSNATKRSLLQGDYSLHYVSLAMTVLSLKY